MKIDILSDLHFDYYFTDYPSRKDIEKIYDKIFIDCGDVLVVAGDLGHDNAQNIRILKMIQRYYYKNIVCVLGNHDYYLSNRIAQDDYDLNSFSRVEEMRVLINDEEDMYCLNGTVIEIDGIRFGGADGWYSDAYLKYKYPFGDFPLKSNNEMWRNCMPDSDSIFGIKNFDDIHSIEKPKLLAVYKECDVMITHVNPSFKDEHMSPKFIGEQSNTFFCFNGHEYLKDGSMMYWVFGHTHDAIEYELHGVKCICNPFGYSSESRYGDNISIKSIFI